MLSPTRCSKNSVTLPLVFSSAARNLDRSATGTIQSDFTTGRAWLSDPIFPAVVGQLPGSGGRKLVRSVANLSHAPRDEAITRLSTERCRPWPQAGPYDGDYDSALQRPLLTVRSKIPSVARSADSGTIGKRSLYSSPILD